jgi:type II secretory pathway component PulJ
MQHTSTKQSGFTLVEIAIITPIVILVLGGIVALLIGLMTDTIASRTELELTHDTTNALHIIEDDVKLTSAFLTTKGSAFTDPYGSDGLGGTWSYKGVSETSRTLILQAYATTRSPRDSLKAPVYINENGCSADFILSNPTLTTNIIYYINNGSLYRRTLTDTSQNTCQTPFQRQSCPPNLASPDPVCKTDDVLLLSNVTSFIVHYYNDPASGTPLDVYPSSSSTVLDPTVSVRVKLDISKNLGTRNFFLHRELQVSNLNTAN